MSEQHAEREHQVRPLELLFDLVFVFAFTQVTTVLSDNPTWSGLGHGLLILAALWWAWASYAWLTNTLDADLDAVSVALLAAMAAMFIAALAVPDAFGRHGVVFGVAFLIVNVMHLTLYALGARDDRDLLAAILRIAPTALAGATLILAAGLVHGTLRPPALAGRADRRVRFTASQWLERLARGARALHRASRADRDHCDRRVIDCHRPWRKEHRARHRRHRRRFTRAGRRDVVLVGVLRLLPDACATLLADRSRSQRTALARDVYTYLHLPMVAGIILFAFALKVALAHVSAELDTIPALCLCGGPALYLFAYVGVRFRISRVLRGGRLIAGVACALLFPVALLVPALAALALVAAVWVALHAYELVWWHDARAQARALRAPASAS